MSLQTAIDKFLLRDLLTYLFPGIAIVLIVSVADIESALLSNFFKNAKSLLGDKLTIVFVLSVTYMIGHLNFQVGWNIKKIIGKIFNLQKVEMPVGLRKRIVEQFPEYGFESSPRKLVALCCDIIHITDKEIYYHAVERRIAIRNFRVSIASTFIFSSVILYCYDKISVYFSLGTLVTGLVLLYMSHKKEKRLRNTAIRIASVMLASGKFSFNSELKQEETKIPN